MYIAGSKTRGNQYKRLYEPVRTLLIPICAGICVMCAYVLMYVYVYVLMYVPMYLIRVGRQGWGVPPSPSHPAHPRECE